MDWEWITLILIGTVLIAVDVYLPGVILASIGGILQIVTIVVLACTSLDVSTVALLTVGVILLDGLVLWCSVRFFPQTRMGKKMILGHSQQNFRAGGTESLEPLVGKEGVAESPLRPSGVALVEGRRMEVMTEAEYVGRGERIKILAVKEGRLIVSKLS